MSGQPLPSSFDGNADFFDENRWQKFTRRLKEEPLIPFGCALTCYALYGAAMSIRRGDHNTTQTMFRARVYAQAFTLVCLVAGSYYYAEERAKRKEWLGVKANAAAKEKNDAWIKELEARDREDQEERENKEKLREKARRGRMGVAGEDGVEAIKALGGAEKGMAEKIEAAVKTAGGLNNSDKDGIVKSVLERGEERRRGILDAVRDLGWR